MIFDVVKKLDVWYHLLTDTLHFDTFLYRLCIYIVRIAHYNQSNLQKMKHLKIFINLIIITSFIFYVSCLLLFYTNYDNLYILQS